MSSAVGSIPVPVYRSSHSEEYRQGLEAIRGLNLMAQGYVYRNGKYYKGATRGNGIVGEDVTKNIATIKNVPKELKEPISIKFPSGSAI